MSSELHSSYILALAFALAAAALACLYAAKRWNREVEFLKSVTTRRCNELPDLLIDSSQPLIVAISGRVGSKTPIPCKLSGLDGVIVKEQVKVDYHYYGRENDDADADALILDSTLLSSTYREVPWYVDDGTGGQHVFIRGRANAASCFTWPVEKKVYEMSIRTSEFIKSLGVEQIESLMSTCKAPLNAISKTVGVERMEWLLPTGTSVTVVGEAVRDDDSGRVWIERPRKGQGRFYVSPWTLDGIIDDVRKTAGFSKGIAVFFMIAVLALLFLLPIAHYELIDGVRLARETAGFI